MKVAVYARVSTRDQNAESQLQDLRRYCASRGWEIINEFIDVGISGAKDDRPALRGLMHCVRQRRADVVLVWRFDRFARSVKHLVNALAEITALGMQFVSYSEDLDSSTPTGRLMFHLLGLMAEFERDLIRERIHAGLRRARAEGILFGRPRRIDFVNMEKACQLHAQGRSLRQIRGELGIPIATLSRLFQKPSPNFGTSPVETEIQK